MRVKLLGWLLLSLLSAQAVLFTALAIEQPYACTTRQEEALGLGMAGRSPEEGVVVKDKIPNIVSVSRKGGKGKGAYGGANVVHRPPRGSAAPSLVSPLLVLLLLMCVSLVFIST